jgi:hypothetical protein
MKKKKEETLFFELEVENQGVNFASWGEVRQNESTNVVLHRTDE